MERVAFDTMVLINLLTKQEPDVSLLQPLLRQAEMGILEIVISEVTVAESCRLDGDIDPDRTVKEYLSRDGFRRFPVTPSVSEKAAQLIRKHSLEACDAMIVANSLVHRCSTLYTRDNTSVRKPIRESQKTPIDAATELEGMAIRSPDRDPDLCARAGVAVKGTANAKEPEADSKAGTGPGDPEGGGSDVGGSDDPRAAEAEAGAGVAGSREEGDAEEGEEEVS